jgi:antitoxin PrlF
MKPRANDQSSMAIMLGYKPFPHDKSANPFMRYKGSLFLIHSIIIDLILSVPLFIRIKFAVFIEVERPGFVQKIKKQNNPIFQKSLNLQISFNVRGAELTEDENDPCCTGKMSRCKVESIVTVDERGQMVLPKEIRERANILSGDKLAVVSLEKDGKICCLSLIKAEDLEVMVKSMLGPVMDDVFKR